MYDAPSARGMKIYVAPAGMPVEVILTSGAWCRVRDMSGDLSWVEAKDLITQVATSSSKRPLPGFALLLKNLRAMVFSADKHVLLEMAEPAIGAWVKVKAPRWSNRICPYQ